MKKVNFTLPTHVPCKQTTFPTHVRFKNTLLRIADISYCSSYNPTGRNIYMIRVEVDQKDEMLFFEYQNREERDRDFDTATKWMTGAVPSSETQNITIN